MYEVSRGREFYDTVCPCPSVSLCDRRWSCWLFYLLSTPQDYICVCQSNICIYDFQEFTHHIYVDAVQMQTKALGRFSRWTCNVVHVLLVLTEVNVFVYNIINFPLHIDLDNCCEMLGLFIFSYFAAWFARWNSKFGHNTLVHYDERFSMCKRVIFKHFVVSAILNNFCTLPWSPIYDNSALVYVMTYFRQAMVTPTQS